MCERTQGLREEWQGIGEGVEGSREESDARRGDYAGSNRWGLRRVRQHLGFDMKCSRTDDWGLVRQGCRAPGENPGVGTRRDTNSRRWST